MLDIKINSQNKLIDYIGNLENSEKEYIYRGQSDSGWVLCSSLYRFFESKGVNSEYRAIFESKAVENFKENLALYNYDKYHALSDIDAMVVMQHYGCPTRLLDWTLSPYIALYFIVHDIISEGTLYVLNITDYQNRLAPKLPFDDYNHAILKRIPDRNFRFILREKDKLAPIPLQSQVNSPNTINQQSFFLVDVDLGKSTETAIIDFSDKSLIKVNIDISICDAIKRMLQKMNVDGRHLFENLNGLAYNAKEYLSIKDIFGTSINLLDLGF